MSILISQQIFKAFCGHLRHPLRHPLRRPLRRPLRCSPRPFSNHLGSLQVPFSESPGYYTLARHFSSYSNPLKLIALSSWQNARDSSDFVDIHDIRDISDLELNKYDVLITDIDEKTLRGEISQLFGIEYLAKATEEDARRDIDTINGYLYGEWRRAIVPCVVSNGNKAYWVHFVVDTGAPITFLSEKVHAPTYAESILSC
jgi:hypothetical protein